MNADPTTAASGGQEAGAIALFMCSDMKFNSWEVSPDTVKDEYRFAAKRVLDAARTHSSPPSPARGEELEAGALEKAVAAFWAAGQRDNGRGALSIAIRTYVQHAHARPPVTTDAGAVTREELVALLKKHVPHVPIVGISADMQFGMTADAILARLARAEAAGGEKRTDASDGEAR